MNKEKNIIRFYVLCNKLKDLIRTGWENWNVTRDRLESVAEHIFGVQMLAIAMHSEYQYDLDIKKIIYMLAIHELEEIYIGDLTMYQVSKEEKEKLGHEAIQKVLKDLLNKDELLHLILEFDERKTPEARFAYWCDKLECDLQCKLYDEQYCVDLNNQEGNDTIKDEQVSQLLKTGQSWSSMWMSVGKSRYNYDENFMKVSNYAQNNNISDIDDE